MIGIAILMLLNSLTAYLHEKVSGGDIGSYFEQNPYKYMTVSGFLTGVQTFLFYLKRLIIPFPLLFYYGYNMLPVKGWNTPDPYIVIVIFSVSLVFIAYSFNRKKYIFMSFALLLFLGTLFPFCNFISQYYITGIVAERLVYQASAGFCLFVALLLFEMPARFQREKNRLSLSYKWTYVLLACIAVPFAAITINRNTQWQNRTALFEHDIKYLSQSARANFLMASRYMIDVNKNAYPNPEERKRVVLRAKSYLHQALKVYPEYNDVWTSLGVIQRQFMGNADSAFICLNKVDTTNRFVYARAQELLGDLSYGDLKDRELAKSHYLNALKFMPEGRTLYRKAIQMLFETARYDTILTFSDYGIQRNYIESYLDKADAYVNLKDTAAAVPYYKKAIELGFNGPLLIDLNGYLTLHKIDIKQ
jgi:tetratricopeptide (TPR) repeat protein